MRCIEMGFYHAAPQSNPIITTGFPYQRVTSDSKVYYGETENFVEFNSHINERIRFDLGCASRYPGRYITILMYSRYKPIHQSISDTDIIHVPLPESDIGGAPESRYHPLSSPNLGAT